MHASGFDGIRGCPATLAGVGDYAETESRPDCSLAPITSRVVPASPRRWQCHRAGPSALMSELFAGIGRPGWRGKPSRTISRPESSICLCICSDISSLARKTRCPLYTPSSKIDGSGPAPRSKRPASLRKDRPTRLHIGAPGAAGQAFANRDRQRQSGEIEAAIFPPPGLNSPVGPHALIPEKPKT